MAKSHITSDILMVRPAHFGYNQETAKNNSFQKNDKSLNSDEISKRAMEEFDQLVSMLRSAGVEVLEYKEPQYPVLTDSIFPNNWITTHEDGGIITYPMYSAVRQQERRSEVIDLLSEEYLIQTKTQLEHYEQENIYLEGTGSMILDRIAKKVYACRSVRTDEAILDDFCRIKGYDKILFNAVDHNNIPIYHTNVMMCIGKSFAVICLESIKDSDEKNRVIYELESSGKSVIKISLDQVGTFAGNMLQVSNNQGDHFLVMSTKARGSLSLTEVQNIEKHTEILHSPIPTIEKYGGGGVRCMMAEIFLPKKHEN